MHNTKNIYALTNIGITFLYLVVLIIGIILGFILNMTIFTPMLSQNCNSGIMKTNDGIYETKFCIIHRMAPKE